MNLLNYFTRNEETQFYIKYLLLGLSFSALATAVCDTIGIPTIPEFVFFPFLIKWKDDFCFEKPWRNKITLLFLLWALMIGLALAQQRFTFGAILTNARAYLYMGVFAIWSFCLKYEEKTYKILYFTSIGSLIGWAITVILQMSKVIILERHGITYGNMVVIPFSIASVFALYPYLKYAIPAISLNVFLSFTTSLRRQILASFLSLGFSYLLSLKNRKAYKIHLPLVFAIFIVAFNLEWIGEQVKQHNEYTYRRVFERSQNAGAKYDKGDTERKENYVFIYETFDKYHLPHGFVSKRTQDDHELGRFSDCPLYELLYTFGNTTVLLALGFYLVLLFMKGMTYFMQGNPVLLLWIVSGCVCFYLLFVENTFLSYTYTTPITGIVIGAICRNSRRLII